MKHGNLNYNTIHHVKIILRKKDKSKVVEVKEKYNVEQKLIYGTIITFQKHNLTKLIINSYKIIDC